MKGKTHCQFSVLGFPVLWLRAKPAIGVPRILERLANMLLACHTGSGPGSVVRPTTDRAKMKRVSGDWVERPSVDSD